MMELDEGKSLLDLNFHHQRNSESVAANHLNKLSVDEIVDNCINNPKPWKPLEFALCLALGNAADAVEIMCIGFIMSDISKVTTLQKELLSAAVFMGMFFGGLFGGYIADRIGRQRALLYSLGTNALAGFASTFSPSVEILILFRVFAGLGIGASVPIVFSLGAELFPTVDRGYYLSLIASFWMVGAIFSAFSAWILLGDDFYGDKILPHIHWRWFAFVSGLPAFLAFLLSYYRLPESPRFLINKQRLEEARVVLNRISTVRLSQDDLILDTPQPAVQKFSATVTPLSHHQIGGEIEYGNISQNIPSVNHNDVGDSDVEISKMPLESLTMFGALQLLFGQEFRAMTIVLMTIWFTLSFGSYGISTWISILFADVGIGNPYAASFIFALANLPGNLISLWFIDRFGRRWLLSVGMCLAGLASIGFALDTSNQAIVVLFASLFNAFSVIGWNSLDCISAEGFPTIARTSAMGILAGSGRLGAVAGQFVNGTLETNIPLLLFVTSACSIFGGLVSWALPQDTAGTSLGNDVDRKVSISS
jgi:MFS family permease